MAPRSGRRAPVPALAAALNYSPPAPTLSPVTDLDTDLRAKNQTGGGSLREMAGGHRHAHQHHRRALLNWDPSNDRDYTGLPITTLSQNPSKQQHIRRNALQHPDQEFDVQVGAFAFNQAVHTTGTQQQGSAPAASWPFGTLANDPAVLNGLTAKNDIRLNNTSLAFYGQASWKVTDWLTIQPGASITTRRPAGTIRWFILAAEHR
jgi:iron complex outermembrane receptor protein